MNEENDFNFKDKEIEKITSDILKASKHQLGESFQDAIARGGSETAPVTPDQPDEASATVPNSAPVQGSDASSPPAPTEESSAAITPLQTYERDIAEAIRSSNESVASINLAQQKRMQEKGGARRTEKIARKGLTLLISGVLIISTVVISALVYFFVINRPGPVVPTTPSIITTDERKQIDVTNLKAQAVAEKIRAEYEKSRAQISVGKIIMLELVEDVAPTVDDISNPNATSKKMIPIEKFFEFFALSSPPTLGRALSDQWAFGFQFIDNMNGSILAPFIFAKVDSFDNAFEGMNRWEERMVENVNPIFFSPETKQDIQNTSTTTATASATSTLSASSTNTIGTTSPTSIPASTLTINKTFEDKIIRSKDTRVLKNSAGNTILLYSFLDQKNLVITTNEKTFEEILNRFFASQIVR